MRIGPVFLLLLTASACGSAAAPVAGSSPSSASSPVAQSPTPSGPHLTFTGTIHGVFDTPSVECKADPQNFNQQVVRATGKVGSQELQVSLVITANNLVSFIETTRFAFNYVAPAQTATGGSGFDIDSDLFNPPFPPGTPVGTHVSGRLACQS